ncbi:helix-turn-helix domain-containing protein [Vibrio sp. JC009]|uniref:helix-turn-helix domain-containing protein n=1 Tax=Vibrio sp. JC009 TaxID=2912314 RepID=UPI0023B14D40|nr:helix-turn-helix domain-containing protein [Vibrio sp. JC009]WED20902.1 helix-turn-helix domain-containing protein [Vibrio sp. JC009]
MINIQDLQQTVQQIEKNMPWLRGISNQAEYEQLIELMNELVEDYDANQTLIDLMFPVIHEYESKSEQFSEFNKAISELNSGVAVLRVIIDQYNLTLSDFQNEIGAKSTVSMILSGKRSLTLAHIRALSERFNIPPQMFI